MNLPFRAVDVVVGIPHLNDILAVGKLRKGVGLLPQGSGNDSAIRLNGIHGVIAVIVRGTLVIDGQLAGRLQIQIVDRILQSADAAGSGNGNGAVGCISGCHVMDDDPQELHSNGNGNSDDSGFIGIPDIEDIVSHIQSGKLIGLLPLGILIRDRGVFSGHRQQGELVAAGYLSGSLGCFAVIDAAGDLTQVDRDLAIAV